MLTIHVWPRYIKDFLLTHFGCNSPVAKLRFFHASSPLMPYLSGFAEVEGCPTFPGLIVKSETVALKQTQARALSYHIPRLAKSSSPALVLTYHRCLGF